MREKRIKKCMSLTLTLALFLCLFSQTIYARSSDEAASSPRSAMRILMEASTDGQEELYGRQEIQVTVTWLESMAMKEPVKIAVTDDAQIMAEQASDIIFETNGIQKEITDLSVEEGAVRFLTGKAESRSVCKLIYKVKAPMAQGAFKISTKVAAENAPQTMANYIERTFEVTSGLTVDCTYETVNGSAPFHVFGQVNYRTQEQNPDLVLSLDVYNEATGEIVYELTGAALPENNSYDIGPVVFPDTCEDGTYIVYVTLADGWDIIGSASKKIIYAGAPLTVQTSADTVNGQTPFDVFGLLKYRSTEENPDMVVSIDVYNKETEAVVYEMTGTDYPVDDTYRIAGLKFPESCESGVYVICATAADGMNIIGTASAEVTYVK